MTRNPRLTFEEIVRAVAPRNARRLEEKARRAGELVRAYPLYTQVLEALEDRLLQQLWKVLAGQPNAAQSGMGFVAPTEEVSPTIQ